MIGTGEKSDRWMVIVVQGQGSQEQCKVTLKGVSHRIAQNYAKGFNRPKKKAQYPHARAIVCDCR